ncbi:MAG TPA: ABC transporter substrate-binding protein [Flavobacterium sp.]|nr:ABC transporter substrate-binding protein [Flavobacterium sp.]
MKIRILLFVISCFLMSCKTENKEVINTFSGNELITHSKGLRIKDCKDFYLLEVVTPWPDAKKGFQYVLSRDIKTVPDSLKKLPIIQIPVKRIIPTSTTHISSIASLNNIQSIIAFPHLQYVSSSEVRKRIKSGEIVEVADKNDVNFEMAIDLAPDAIIAHSMQPNNPKYDQLQNAGISVIYNGDWVEETPLGKAEWIKFFGVLFDEYEQADAIFQNIVKEYNATKALVSHIDVMPKVISGSLYEDVWYAPKGDSWMAQFIKDAKGDYVWKNSSGKGSLHLSFEQAFEVGEAADVWIGPGQFATFIDLEKANRHYAQFKSFKEKKVYSYSTKKGPGGGIIFYEDAPNRPDLILKDLVYILHPQLLPDYQPVFIEALK